MTENEYLEQVSYYETLGYSPIGTKDSPYYIPTPTEEMKQKLTESFKIAFAKHIKK